MPRTGRCSTSRMRMVTLLFLCLCVLMQMLGTTMTLWDFQLQLEPVNGLLLEGLSLPAGVSDVTSLVVTTVLDEDSPHVPRHLHDTRLLHPPILSS
ncbi:MAG TPA: hypothetical protein VFS39_09145 [Nitrospira sp.]|nr:hypothetical protein [Nitrospira sp.]